jgi:hypothetical protein
MQFELRRLNGFIEAHSNSKTQAIELANSIARRNSIPIAVIDTSDDDAVVFRALPPAQPERSRVLHNQHNVGTSRPTRPQGRPAGLDLEEEDEQAITDLAALLEARMMAVHEAQAAKEAHEPGDEGIA